MRYKDLETGLRVRVTRGPHSGMVGRILSYGGGAMIGGVIRPPAANAVVTVSVEPFSGPVFEVRSSDLEKEE